MEIRTTPINCLSCACELLDAFDNATGGSDPVADRIADMARTSLVALLSAAQASRDVSMRERGMTVQVQLEGLEQAVKA